MVSVKTPDVGFALLRKSQNNLFKFSKMVRAKKSFSQQRVWYFVSERLDDREGEIRVKAGGKAELVLH